MHSHVGSETLDVECLFVKLVPVLHVREEEDLQTECHAGV